MQKNNPIASVVIPNWNGKHLLKICLPSLEKQTLKGFEIIVADNGSSDGSLEYVKDVYPHVKTISLKKNYGFAKAVNEGIKVAKGKYLVLLNNDTEADKNFVKFLVEAAGKHTEVGFVACKMLNFYKRDLIDSAGDAVDVVGHSYNIGLGEKDGSKYSRAGYIFLVTAGGSLYKRQVFEKVGYFDEDYDTYMEDVDLGLRAQLAGFKAWYEPKAILFHMRKATSKKIGAKSEYWHFRNMTQNIIKDYPAALFLKDFNWLKILLVNLNTVFYMAKKGLIWQALLSEGYIVTHIPKLLQKRSWIQKMKIVSDDYIIQNIRPKKVTFWGLWK